MEARPFMTTDKFKCLECGSVEYGNPSGHSISVTFYGFFVMFVIFQGSFPNIVKGIISILILAWIFLTMMSRVLVGAHSLGQVLLGCAYGFLLILVFTFWSNDWLNNKAEEI